MTDTKLIIKKAINENPRGLLAWGALCEMNKCFMCRQKFSIMIKKLSKIKIWKEGNIDKFEINVELKLPLETIITSGTG